MEIDFELGQWGLKLNELRSVNSGFKGGIYQKNKSLLQEGFFLLQGFFKYLKMSSKSVIIPSRGCLNHFL